MAAALIARNRIQKLFLAEQNTEKLFVHVVPLSTHEKRYDASAEFEKGDWDVHAIIWSYRCECDSQATLDGARCSCRYAKESDTVINVRCTIQATIGDDYPTVLRKMSKRVEKTHNQRVKERAQDVKQARALGQPLPSPSPTHYVLLVGELTTEEITREELSQIFDYKGIKVVFLDNLGCAPQ